MGKFRNYFLAQLKRVFRAFPFIAAMTLLLTGCLALLAASVMHAYLSSEEKQKLQVGVVGDASGSYLGFGIMAIQMLDSSRFAIDFVQMTEEEAEKRMRSGKMSAYVSVPEGFAEAFEKDEEVYVTYVTSDQTSGVGVILMKELVKAVSDVVVESRNAINGTWVLLAEQNVEGDFGAATDRLFLRYVELFLNRTELWPLDLCGISNRLTFAEYYAIAVLILFLLFWGITGSSLFVKRDASLAKFWKAKGQGVFGQVCAEYLAYFLLMLGSLFLVYVPAAALLPRTGVGLPEGFFPAAVLFLVRMVPAAALLAGLQFFLYELISDVVSGILLQFMAGISLAYLSGCLYPVSFLPEAIQKLAPLLPSGAALQYGIGWMRNAATWREACYMALCLLLFLGLAAGVRERRVKA